MPPRYVRPTVGGWLTPTLIAPWLSAYASVTALAVFPPSAHALFSGLAFAAIASHLRGASGSVWPALALRFGASVVGVAALLTRHDDDHLPRNATAACVVAAGLALLFFFVLARRGAQDTAR